MVADLVDEAAPVGIEHSGGGGAPPWPGSIATVAFSPVRDGDGGEISVAVSLSEQALGQFERMFPRFGAQGPLAPFLGLFCSVPRGRPSQRGQTDEATAPGREALLR